uniref:Aa_trans domain-containing protein n=1 Tax=Rhabditophanes sp. KR3021 TaxID=114890 RepID=A0AC35U4P4_9BILA
MEIPNQVIGKKNGLHWVTTALFIVADMAGGGIVSMPMAMTKSGLIAGIAIMAVLFLIFTYTAHLLGINWLKMCKFWPEYKSHCRKPYPEMAMRSMGIHARTFTSCVLNVMLYGVSIVYLLLSSQIINDIVSSLTGVNIGSCVMLLIVAGMMLPVTFLKSPQDFWWAIVVAMFTTLFAVIIIFSGTLIDYETCAPEASFGTFKMTNLFLSLGTFMFSFGGHGVFPTIQHDMKKPYLFTRSAIFAFILVILMYAPVTILGYITYGNSVQNSIISSLQTPLLQNIANAFIAIHCLLTVNITINPLNQELEHVLETPHHFCWQRVFVRTGVMALVVFTAESIPTFGPILTLIGGTSVTLTSALLPCLFNLYLETRLKMIKKNNGEKKEKKLIYPSIKDVIQNTRKWKLLLNITIVIVATICGVATTISAIKEMGDSQFSMPCYLRFFNKDSDHLSALDAKLDISMYCCGSNRNISKHGDLYTCLSSTS